MVKAILKGIGGAISGTSEAAQAAAKLQNGQSATNIGAVVTKNATSPLPSQQQGVANLNEGDETTAAAATKAASNIDGLNDDDNKSSGMNAEKASGIFNAIGDKMKDGKGKDFMQKAGSFMGKVGKAFSDEELKDACINEDRLNELFDSDDRVKSLARINSYDFTYKPEAQNSLGLDGELHTGVMAQELENNPLFKGCVSTDPNTGFKVLNIKELTAANTAAIGDLSRKIEELERIIGER